MNFSSRVLMGLIALVAGCDGRRPTEQPTEDRAREGNTLEYRWNPKQRLHYRFDVSQDLEIQDSEGPHRNYLRLTQDYTLQPEASSDGTLEHIRMVFSHLQVSMKEGVSEGSYNSKDPEVGPSVLDRRLAEAFGPIAHAEVKLTLSESQEIEAVLGLAPLLQRVTQAHTTSFRELFHSIYADDPIRQLVYLTPFPQGNFKSGNAWPVQETRQLGILGPTSLDGTAQLLGEEIRGGRPVHQIRFIGTAKTALMKEAIRSRAFLLENGQFDGRASFDPQLGQYLDRIVTYHLDVSPNRRVLQNIPDDSEITVTQKYSTRLLEIVPVGP